MSISWAPAEIADIYSKQSKKLNKEKIGINRILLVKLTNWCITASPAKPYISEIQKNHNCVKKKRYIAVI